MSLPAAHPNLSVIILAANETDPLEALLSELEEGLRSDAIAYEMIVVDSRPGVNSQQVAKRDGVNLVPALGQGYGAALQRGFQQATGEYLFVMDADQVEPLRTLHALWVRRNEAEVVIASRYIPGGKVKMPFLRLALSRLLNVVFSRGLDLPVRDMSSGIRLYKNDVLGSLEIESKTYAILQEILVKTLMEGYRICEIPIHYQARHNWRAYERALKFGLDYGKTFLRLWRLRNSIASADYDARAFNALMPPQRYWQRQRYKHITGLLQGKGRCLDVGCGSSRIMSALPAGSAGLDILRRKLRYARAYGIPTLQGSALELPIRTGAFPCVICSQVIEHIPRGRVLGELDRVLAPGGLLILGTPDYARWQWRVIEWLYKLLLPQAYADEHITHYTAGELQDEFILQRGYRLMAVRTILKGELILGIQKPPFGDDSSP
jgi:dolichol-phosphate mannosyltransferase